MKIGKIILLALLLCGTVGFSKSPGAEDTVAKGNNVPSTTAGTTKSSTKGTGNFKAPSRNINSAQAKAATAVPNLPPIRNLQLDTLSGYLSRLETQLRTQDVDIQQLKVQLKEKNISHITWDKILLLLTTGLVLVLLILFISDKKKRKDEILYVLTGRRSDHETHRLSEWKKEIIETAVQKAKQIPPPGQGSKTNNQELELTIRELQTRVADLEDASRKKTNEFLNGTEEKDQTVNPIPTSKTLYADAIINNILNKVTEHPNADTVYELFLKNSTSKNAELSIYKEAYRRVIETPDFIEGCEKQRTSNTPKDLLVERGEVQLQDNGKWQIIKKANVKFV